MQAKRESAVVSSTGNFAPVSATNGNMAPVGDELVYGVDPQDMYIEDADDSVYEAQVTATGAYAGPGYVEMPQKKGLLGRFRKKDKQQEQSSWQSFGADNGYYDDGQWNGGAFSKLRANMPSKGDRDAQDGIDAKATRNERAASSQRRSQRPNMDAVPLPKDLPLSASIPEVDEQAAIQAELEQIHGFHAKTVNNEVWCVALGSDMAANGGAKAFMAEHADDLRGAVIINLEGLGAGTFAYYETEGAYKPKKISSRLKRIMKAAQRDTGISVAGASMTWKDSLASLAMKARIPAVTMTGLDNGKPAYFGRGDDVLENIDPEALAERIDFVEAMVRNV